MNEKELNYEKIKSMIYTIRGDKVMLDFDLAKIYGYETKVFNQQVKRNIDKFQKECIFKLKNDEFLVARSQNVTAQIWATNNGGRTTLPYAFTEQGIKTLSTVLRGTNVSDITSMLLEMITNVELSTTEKWLSEANKYEIVKFESGDITLDVNVSPDEDTVWLTQNEIAILYDTTISNISMHITNIFDSNELKKDSVIKKSLTTATDGKTYNVTYYNLDVVLIVGYRVNTKRSMEFRKWANNILKQYLIKGYSINTKRCLEHSDIIMRLSKDINELKETTKDIKEIKEKIEKVMDNFIDPNTYKEFLILKGQKIEANIAYQTIYKLAKKSIYILDDYIDIKTLQLLKISNLNVEIIIFSDNKGKNNLNSIYINEFINETNYKVWFKKNNKTFHDRYIVIDYKTNNEIIYHCGASSKDSGNTMTTISRIEDREIYHNSIEKLLINDELKF